MAKVFISFIHEEAGVAKALHELLQKAFPKESIFLTADEWQIIAGEKWLDRIKQELSEAEVVVLLLSASSVQRPWVNFEAGAAWLTQKPIIPACYGGVSKGSLPKPYSDFQALDLPADYYFLIHSVAKHLKHLISPPPIFFDSKELKQLEQAIEDL